MPPLRRKRRSKVKAPSTLYYTDQPELGARRYSIYAECQYGGAIVGPIYGHGIKSAKKALATLTRLCDCGRRYHVARECVGAPVLLS